jgi:hypothetical protein
MTLSRSTQMPLTTVICAVWHGDHHRSDLLLGHQANLDKQTTPLDRVYVFDGGDEKSPNLKGKWIATGEALSIYEAWNLALTMVRTPFVMNLNLDDRLAPDAVAVLERALTAGADLVGGDWKICYSQSETDAVATCLSCSEMPFVPDWPPHPGTFTRLGSGTGERGTYGPACMWRMSLHATVPRFPFMFSNGELIRVIGDAVWWQMIKGLGKKLVRLPLLIGNYHSHPKTQAEFRASAAGEDEFASLKREGVSFF